jgi:hypothetical protein
MWKKIFISSILFCFSCKNKQKIKCELFQTGLFFQYSKPNRDTITIERNANFQVEKNLKTGKTIKSYVEWVEPCKMVIRRIKLENEIWDRTDSFLALPQVVEITKSQDDFYIFKIRIDSVDKFVEFTDTVYRQQKRKRL